MKNIKKWLALMLAGMMIATSLTACYSVDVPDDEDEDEAQSEKADKNDDKDDTDKDDSDKDDSDKDDSDGKDTDKDDTDDKDTDENETNGLSPEEVWKKIVDEDDVTVEFEYFHSYDGEESEMTDCYEKDGDKVKNGYVYDGEAGTFYLDLAEELEYFEFEGEWYTEECSYSSWEDLLDVMFADMEFMFDDDNYDKAGEVYTVTDRAIEDFLDQYPDVILEDILGEGEIKVDAGMKMQSADEYIFHVNMSSEDGEYNTEFTVAFKSVSVELPEATAEYDDDDVITDLPEVPTVLPTQLYDAILNEDEMNIEVWIFEGEDAVSYDFTKSGNRLSLDYWDGDDVTTVYFDFDKETYFYYDENYDLCSEPFEEEMTWESTVDEINDLVFGILSIDDDDVVLDTFWGYVVTDDLCEEYGFDRVLYTCNDSFSIYGYDVFTEDFENSYEITVSFEDVSLYFPTV